MILWNGFLVSSGILDFVHPKGQFDFVATNFRCPLQIVIEIPPYNLCRPVYPTLQHPANYDRAMYSFSLL